ncbi:Cytochrome P450 6k1 [Gonioctena quinquepunctata]|nr:Cytochrome P450 6k1 [Gonioctena quinquepunctata]
MVFFTSSWLLDFTIVLIVFVILLWKYSIRKFDYWNKRGVYNPKPLPFLGNLADVLVMRRCLSDWIIDLYASTNVDMFGLFVFDRPLLMLRDPKLIQHIFIKDFNHFTDRSSAEPPDEIMSNFMFFQKSPEWKSDRVMLTPVFTSAKLKGMFTLVDNISKDFVDYLTKNLGVIEAKEITLKYTTNVIAKCAFGIDAHCFEEENADFLMFGHNMSEFNLRNTLVNFIYLFRPELVDKFQIEFFNKSIMNFFQQVFSEAIKLREMNDVRVNDFVDLLIDLKNSYGTSAEKANQKACGQAIMFFGAGVETTSSAISFTLHELCLNKDVQDRLRKEIIQKIEEHGGITYEAVRDMTYLRMCVNETLRKYPAIPFLDRKCNADYSLPGTNLLIEKGMSVYVPVVALHWDEKYFPNPERYDPERFAKKDYNMEGLVYLPFGAGPRNCIGERFGLLSTQLALIRILLDFEVEKCAGTPDPVRFTPRSLTNQSKDGLPMRLKKIN